jgi:hypothetical protein
MTNKQGRTAKLSSLFEKLNYFLLGIMDEIAGADTSTDVSKQHDQHPQPQVLQIKKFAHYDAAPVPAKEIMQLRNTARYCT